MGSDFISGNNGQVLTYSGVVSGNTVWITPSLPTIIWTGIIGGGGGGVGQVITSAPQTQQQGQLDLPGVPDTTPEKKADGATCKGCEEFNEFARPNQDDDTFLCYRCRHNL